MGSDKPSLPFGSETMLERVTRIARSVADDVIVVGRRDQGASTVHDATEDQGPLAGIAAGLSASTTDLNIVVACDMPLINPEVLKRLVSLIGDHDACVAVVDEHASALCGVYRSRVAAAAQALLDAGERRLMRLLDRVQTKRVDAAVFRDIDPNLDTFLSCDTPEAYRAALLRLKPDATGSPR
jgi:molybdopterin-guanine dinucleotide biosynthesis protein A